MSKINTDIVQGISYHSLDVDHLYTVSEFIELLTFMKEKYGDLPMMIEYLDNNANFARCGFNEVSFHDSSDIRNRGYLDMEDNIIIHC